MPLYARVNDTDHASLCKQRAGHSLDAPHKGRLSRQLNELPIRTQYNGTTSSANLP